jgi:hypothetical protein
MSVLKQWQKLARAAIDAARDDEDPGRVIEERVLAQLKETFGDEIITTNTKPKDKPPTPHELGDLPDKPGKKGKPAKAARPAKGGESVADGLSRLNELREAGALTADQYTRAVDRLLGKG